MPSQKRRLHNRCRGAGSASARLRTVLMIAYYFPPIGGSGALRPHKLARFLPRYGWRPVILTVSNPDWYYARDAQLLEELPAEVSIVRASMLRSAWIYRLFNPLRVKKIDGWIRRWLMHPDDQLGWIPFAVRTGRRLLDRRSVDAVYSTSSPLSCHLIAGGIRQTQQLPWIADFRDEWFENPDFDFPTRAHRQLHYRLERNIVRTCDQVIAPAAEFCRLLAKHDPGADKFQTLPMGYDAEEIDALKHSRPNPGADKRFVLAFAGMFYASFRPARLIEAVSGLIDEGRVDPRDIRIQFVGSNRADDLGFSDRHGICSFTGFVSHRRALGYLIAADALLLLLSKGRGEHVIPSKTFEYLAIGKPVLAMIPENGDLAAIIRRCGAGLVADFEDLAGIRAAFLNLFQAWQQNRPVLQPDARRIEQYNQAEIARRFAGLLNQMLPAENHHHLEQISGTCPLVDP